MREHQHALGVAIRTGATSFIVVPGKRDATVSHAGQMEHAVRFYRQLMPLCEAANVTLLFEPVRHQGSTTPMFLSSLDEVIELCERLDHSHCRLLFDLYQQHQHTPDLESALVASSKWLGHVELGDSHGRKEPGTGEIDFSHICQLLQQFRYSGLLGLEHGTSLPGEQGEVGTSEFLS
ncbi:MAG: sugar phosphate isomerase/epimerase family protein [Planctomycetaceae bacterium]